MIQEALWDHQRLYLTFKVEKDMANDYKKFLSDAIFSGITVKDTYFTDETLFVTFLAKSRLDVDKIVSMAKEIKQTIVPQTSVSHQVPEVDVKKPPVNAENVMEKATLPNLDKIRLKYNDECVKLWNLVKPLDEATKAPYVKAVKAFLKTQFRDSNKIGTLIAFREIFDVYLLRSMKKNGYKESLDAENVKSYLHSIPDAQLNALYQGAKNSVQ